MIKWIFMHFFLFCLLLILFLTGSLFYYLALTTPGLQTDIQIITKIFPNKLHIQSGRGKLLSDFTLDNITWRDDSAIIHIQSLSFSWDPRDLLQKTFTIRQAIFKNVFIKLSDAEINLNGTFDKNWNVQWKTKIPVPTSPGPEFVEGSGGSHAYSKGFLSVNGNITGPFLEPHMTALLDHIYIPQTGITPRNIHLNGILSRSKILNFTGSFMSGKGQGTLQGSIDFNDTNYPVTLYVKGSRLQAVNLPGYSVFISPDISLNIAKQNIKLQGSVFIPHAEITPQNINGENGLPSDVVFVHAKKTASSPFTTTLQLKLTLGDDIHLAYHNLETHLAGDVQLTQLPGTLINAIGELHTKNGVYKAYGQTLTIKTGRLIYTGGSLMNPGLDILAVKKIKTVNTGGNVSSFSGTTSLDAVYTGTQTLTVGVEVSGTLDNPVFNLYSSPSMAKADILSYLVFGFPQSQASGNQYGAILSALSSLNPNTNSASNFTKNLQEKWGLTQMNVESVQVFNPNATSSSNSVVSATSLVVGKKLSNKLSIHYSVGLFYPVSILNLRYELAKHWAIQSETSTLENGGDVLYTIEED